MAAVAVTEWQIAGGTLSVAVTAATSVGRVRTVNEDALLARFPFYLVADGMGGHSYGDRASAETIKTFQELPAAEPTSVDTVLDAIKRASTSVSLLADTSTEPPQIAGTTLSGIALIEAPVTSNSADASEAADTSAALERAASWLIYNVGDSRTYAFTGSEVRQITHDHSAVQELVDRGEISAEQAETHAARNLVTRAIGAESVATPDTWVMPLASRQVFVLCTDGLTKELSDAEIGGHLAELYRSGAEFNAAESLVRQALGKGGRDNVSVLVVDAQFTPTDAPNATPGAPQVATAELEQVRA